MAIKFENQHKKLLVWANNQTQNFMLADVAMPKGFKFLAFHYSQGALHCCVKVYTSNGLNICVEVRTLNSRD